LFRRVQDADADEEFDIPVLERRFRRHAVAEVGTVSFDHAQSSPGAVFGQAGGKCAATRSVRGPRVEQPAAGLQRQPAPGGDPADVVSAGDGRSQGAEGFERARAGASGGSTDERSSGP
jgi:hypothetical protein